MSGLPVFPFAQSPIGRIARGKALPLAPRIAPAAVRVPDPRHLDIEIAFPVGRPQLFVHEGARQALERKLTAAHHRPVLLGVTDNRRAMISHSNRGGLLTVRVHHMFLDAPPLVQDALVRYIVKSDRDASSIVSRYIHENGFRIKAARPVLTPLTTQGARHDLLSIFRAVNEKYFGGAVDALITWGKQTTVRGTRRTVKLGSYSAVERLIRIHPVLDRPWVPRYFVSYVTYHEMLHHVIPASQGNGRRMLHPPEFVARERLFRDFERAMAWEKAHIHRLLRG